MPEPPACGCNTPLLRYLSSFMITLFLIIHPIYATPTPFFCCLLGMNKNCLLGITYFFVSLVLVFIIIIVSLVSLIFLSPWYFCLLGSAAGSPPPPPPLYGQFHSASLYTRLAAAPGVLFTFDPNCAEALEAARDDVHAVGAVLKWKYKSMLV